MCTLILLRRSGEAWPLLVAANRDEMRDRPWSPPGRHWPERPGVVAGLDRLAGGSWLGLNDGGVIAAILNRARSLGPARNKRSRGILVLEALDSADAVQAAARMMAIEAQDFRPFNMVVADRHAAFWLRHDGARLASHPIPEGLSMLTAHELSDESDGRIADYLPRFRAAAVPDPDAGEWSGWQGLLASRTGQGGNLRSINFELSTGFGTRSSALIALPAETSRQPVFLFAAGPPDRVPWDRVKLD